MPVWGAPLPFLKIHPQRLLCAAEQSSASRNRRPALTCGSQAPRVPRDVVGENDGPHAGLAGAALPHQQHLGGGRRANVAAAETPPPPPGPPPPSRPPGLPSSSWLRSASHACKDTGVGVGGRDEGGVSGRQGPDTRLALGPRGLGRLAGGSLRPPRPSPDGTPARVAQRPLPRAGWPWAGAEAGRAGNPTCVRDLPCGRGARGQQPLRVVVLLPEGLTAPASRRSLARPRPAPDSPTHRGTSGQSREPRRRRAGDSALLRSGDVTRRAPTTEAAAPRATFLREASGAMLLEGAVLSGALPGKAVMREGSDGSPWHQGRACSHAKDISKPRLVFSL